MKYSVSVDDKKYELEISKNSKSLEIRLNGRSIKVDNQQIAIGRLAMILQDNKPFEFELTRENGTYDCWLNSRKAHCEVIDEKTAAFAKLMGVSAGARKADVLKAPMPGLVLRIEVEKGQKVSKGDALVVVEAMKMENELKASRACMIKDIRVSQGQAVDKNQVLIEFE